MKEEFILPNMVLTRDDVRELTTIEFSDDKMQQIANRLSDAFMYEWHDYLADIIEKTSD